MACASLKSCSAEQLSLQLRWTLFLRSITRSIVWPVKFTRNSSAPSSFDGHLGINSHYPLILHSWKCSIKKQSLYLNFPIQMICSRFQVKCASICFVTYGSSSTFSCQSPSPATEIFLNSFTAHSPNTHIHHIAWKIPTVSLEGTNALVEILKHQVTPGSQSFLK